MQHPHGHEKHSDDEEYRQRRNQVNLEEQREVLSNSFSGG
jgi:hypothetical protein